MPSPGMNIVWQSLKLIFLWSSAITIISVTFLFGVFCGFMLTAYLDYKRRQSGFIKR